MRVSLCIVTTLSWMVLAKEESLAERCYSNEYRCSNGQCIPNYKVCDGREDCYYGDDEFYCHSTTEDYITEKCGTNQYECQYGGNCIPNDWVCDGFVDCPYDDDENNCFTDNYFPTSIPSTTITTDPPSFTCGSPFDYIHDRCVLVDPFTSSTWDEALYLCEKFNSSLVMVNDFNFYSKLLQYINNKGLGEHNYWVGARDEQERVWRWLDSTPVHKGAPLWATFGCNGDFNLEPNPIEADQQDCGYLDMTRGFYMSDANCQEHFSSICQRKPSDSKAGKEQRNRSLPLKKPQNTLVGKKDSAEKEDKHDGKMTMAKKKID